MLFEKLKALITTDPAAAVAELETQRTAAEAELEQARTAYGQALLDGNAALAAAALQAADARLRDISAALDAARTRLDAWNAAGAKDAKAQHKRTDDALCAALNASALHLQRLIDEQVCPAIADFLEKNAAFYQHTKRQDVPGLHKARAAIERAIDGAISRALHGDASVKPRSITDEMPAPRAAD